jgi:MFS family permease
MGPALFSMLARGTPVGRASTAQGLFGAVSTLAIIVASVAAGGLFERGIALPFWFFVAGIAISVVVGLLIYRSERAPTVAAPADPAAAR